MLSTVHHKYVHYSKTPAILTNIFGYNATMMPSIKRVLHIYVRNDKQIMPFFFPSPSLRPLCSNSIV